MNIKIEHRNPSVAEYQLLRSSTNWEELSDATVEKGLEGSLFSVCFMVGGEMAGAGRIIGDGAIYFYIQDVIVLPEYQKTGLGDMIMQELESWLKENAQKHSFIGLMASEGVKDFYTRYGYSARGGRKPGMFKMMEK
ncbi:GNAT family N-acetyltransferase [Christiangramia echinicola]|uniref:Acetyltransferase (GNAT) domain-containing protein n=1 Tax=Christiangramia echinicola TaxID=279359 RepID=A0A1H1M4Z2_9FLAO|nr:GNAT family N-acetyltransferase [Christiangramia echinicola]SDR81853.1 Acetyltransferase (GNAT) domain-containing protein [Christiangramia echinicola]